MKTIAKTNHASQQKVADELIHFLADTYSLYLKTQNFHWNVRGVHFHSFHLLFEQQYQELANAVDEIAERIRALGCLTPATFGEFSKLTSLKESSGNIEALLMVKKLLEDHETLNHHAEIIFKKAEEVNDQATMDMLIQRMRVHQKTAWMLRSTLERSS